MKVRELVSLLGNFDPKAEVLLATQPAWPFEFDLAGVIAREEYLALGEQPPIGCASSDVLLLEGEQLRYGQKAAWNAVGR